nr:cysteine-rich receptor-like protein kinase 8 [Ziziphus jujuba var. spinosa]
MANFQGLVKPIPLLSLYLLLALLSHLAYADPPYQLCPNNTSIYANNSPFQKNLNNLLQSLASIASASKFFNTTSGNYPDEVFGSYMCLNYVTNRSCQDCTVKASQAIVSLCPNMKEAVVYEEVCQLRYSNRNFFGQLNVSGNIGKANHFSISEPEKFKSVVNKTLQNFINEATSNLVAKMYAVGRVLYTDRTLIRTLYALVQCATDLSANDCDICLQKATEDILDEYNFSVGARLLSRSCYLRYEHYGFYNSEAEADTNNTKKEEGIHVN